MLSAICFLKKFIASSIASLVGLYLPNTPNTGFVSKILYVFLTDVFILSCKIFFSSGAFKLPVVSIKLPNVALASSIVATNLLAVLSSTPCLARSATNSSTFLGSVIFVMSPSKIKSFMIERFSDKEEWVKDLLNIYNI